MGNYRMFVYSWSKYENPTLYYVPTQTVEQEIFETWNFTNLSHGPLDEILNGNIRMPENS